MTEPMTCPSCARTVDPLRAGHVAIFGERFYYFCDASCRARLHKVKTPVASASTFPTPMPGTPPRSPAGSAAPASSAKDQAATSARAASGKPVALLERALGFPALAPTIADRPSSPSAAGASGPPSVRLRARDIYRADGASEIDQSLLWGALAAGVLAVSLVLAGMTPAVLGLRIGLAWLGWICLMVRAVRSVRDPIDVHPVLILLPGFAASSVVLFAWLVRDPALEEAATFAGIVVTQMSVSLLFLERARQPIAHERMRIAEVLSTDASRASGNPDAIILRQEIKPGEEVAAVAGDVVSVDGSVAAGEGAVVPWLGVAESVRRREGDAVWAGARVISGKLLLRATYTGLDRTWARLTLDPRRRADVHTRVARLARMTAARGGLVGLVLAGGAAAVNGASSVHVALSAIAAYAAITSATVGSMAAVHVGRGILEALRRGIAYRSPLDWDRASDVSILAFCARGTLLLGEPELADLEAVGKVSAEDVLALAAGAESASNHPVAMAIQRAAAARRIRADAVRSPIVHPGLGVLAVASTGEQLCVGSRALMLKEKISVAVAEQKVAEIEAHGREVLLVALAGKLVGAVGLQDGLRPGARAAVQHLLDSQVEPVLLSGDSRETCEAIARALDIEHIRPEVLSSDRAVEVERLAEGGMTVAVLGNPRTDESALSAANIAVAMPAPGRPPGEWGIMLASDDVRDGALAISLARRTKNDARVSLLFAVAPGVVSALAVAFGFLPPAFAPLLAVLGVMASSFHARATDLTRTSSASTKPYEWSRAPDAAPNNKVH